MSRASRAAIRNLAPMMIPLVTKVALPIAFESLRRRKLAADDFVDEQKDVLRQNVKRTRSELDDIKAEAAERGARLYEQARREGTEFLDVLTRRGLEMANEWASGLGEPRRRRRRSFRWAYALGLAALVAGGLVLASRR